MRARPIFALLFLGLVSNLALGQTAGMLSFQGLIKDGGGNPINGTVDLEFRIYDAETFGNVVDMDGDDVVEDPGDDVTSVLGLSVTDGIVSTKFGPVHPAAFDGTERWLELSVDGSPLSRVEMVTAPATAEQVNIAPTGNAAINVDASGNVGIGTTSPAAILDVTQGNQYMHVHEFTFYPLNFGFGGADRARIRVQNESSGPHAGQNFMQLLTVDPSGTGVANITMYSDGVTGFTRGDVGIGTINPTYPLHVVGDGSDNAILATGKISISKGVNDSGTGLSVSRTTSGSPFFFSARTEVDGNAIDAFGGIFGQGNATLHLNRDSSGNVLLANGGGRVGIGTTAPEVRLHIKGGSDTALTGGGYLVLGSTTSTNISIDNNEIMARNNGATSTLFLNNNGGSVRVRVLQIVGADLAEKFPVSEEMKPGMVVEIDPDNPGKLRIARDGAYNRRVAGVVSGANGLSVGVVLGYVPEQEDAPPIALSGRVYVQADTTNGPIQAGDLLTTSNAPGRAMKVKDYGKAQGAIIGKAMTPLKEGKGLVLVLVTLQ
ncbi:MAG: hypothetical protein IH989_05950 [Planctomycetes bacterium]|nr:hypothetical protein [Planctomycetota bacterium]